MARKNRRKRRERVERRSTEGLETWLEQYQRELAEGVPDYSPRAGYLRTQRWCLALIEELEQIVDKKPGAEIHHHHVGDLACIRSHLEKAVAHAQYLQSANGMDIRGCLSCPAKERR